MFHMMGTALFLSMAKVAPTSIGTKANIETEKNHAMAAKHLI